MKKFSQDTRTKIAWEIRKGFSFEQIQENHPNLEIDRNILIDIKKRSIICKYIETNEGLKRYCNNCGFPRLFTNEFFRKDPTGKDGLSSKCKSCVSVIGKNKHIIKSKNPEYKNKRCKYEKDWKKNNPEGHNKREEKRKEKYYNDPEYNKKRKEQNRKSKRKSRAKTKENKYKLLLQKIKIRRELLEFRRLKNNLKAKIKRNVKKILQTEKN